MVIVMSGETLRRRWGEIDVRSEPAGEFGLQATAELMQSAGEFLYPIDDKGVALLDELSDSFTVGDEGLAPFARPPPVGHGAAEIHHTYLDRRNYAHCEQLVQLGVTQ